MSALFPPTALVVPFENLRMTDVGAVGGKNASLGEMISQLPQGLRVPTGFATTAHAFRAFLQHDGLADRIRSRLQGLDTEDVRALAAAGAEIRALVQAQPFPMDLQRAVADRFATLCAEHPGASFAVRSSATAEDLPEASFAGQQESFLNVTGLTDVLLKIKQVFASLYNDRAISYRVHKGFEHEGVALSAGVQRMVRSDLGAAGVMFTIDTESGFADVVFITSSYGLGETVVQGAVNPDEFYVHKPMLRAGRQALIRRTLGSKLVQMVFSSPEEQVRSGQLVQTVDVPAAQRNRYSLTDAEVAQLAHCALLIEQHYGRPMDIEWGKDGSDGEIYILQARPETVKSQPRAQTELRYQLKGQGNVLAEGRAIGQRIGTGPVRLVRSVTEMDRVQPGDVLVTDMTDPNWEPVMKRASAIVTNRGGRTCHAAIIARELSIPAVVGCGDATERLKEGTLVTVSCAEGDTGRVYDGLLETEVSEVQRGAMPPIATKIMMNVGNPQLAFDFAQLPNEGVGLARLEFIINNNIGVHPKAILDYPQIDADLKQAVESVARGHASPRAFYVDKVAEGVATIAAAFWPKPVIVRLSDFKSNEYRKLIGGSRYEPEEENPMLGFRGAVRYLSADFGAAFAMECEALRRVRGDMGLSNVQVMVPFVRTLGQAERVTQLLATHGLERGKDGLKLIMMCEVPSNAILAERFLAFFDGFSIGSNDLTQLTLGLDRDSGLELLAQDFDERDPAVQALIHQVIRTCLAQGKYIGICGQGPSDHPDFAQWLADEGISSISLNPDSVIATWQRLAG
ncbi:phosphoenolpyruvate synthase [Verminephrobacter aporrectodeae]|uniref:phosphoenolpyruvate synthase n=1 Tax=Verminephrobacter aporrectodeae TaxID=1110389 RepID=UPI000237500D|nr:phosphoenolpyruvate synthase [Verminephrobacter aporrectodeae]MCW8166022.1 phosphoenolpyruvate synthase [Verminephrobacter aporrectodeae subsp. tuberculatae]MCW8169715.1 phosphoenolpyruvate synthase [Verminephrobacter aporrectodeae subsp. tuberculatae]MCW8176094.1 phosphoenolpyruvate synthase [Verminephrobacter aporrectodeae subsp. tuberculatae]MCW8203094.1 phosphoenolpyruvate synthase [Verminephrobacter aporrectodeae subsp. tuberculatae]MCW8207904.1 phosphoenolpyruvate synthase [Verminephr